MTSGNVKHIRLSIYCTRTLSLNSVCIKDSFYSFYRSILYPEDVTNFDKLVSLHELRALSLKEKQAKNNIGETLDVGTAKEEKIV